MRWTDLCNPLVARAFSHAELQKGPEHYPGGEAAVTGRASLCATLSTVSVRVNAALVDATAEVAHGRGSR